jgi:hypothetical protein
MSAEETLLQWGKRDFNVIADDLVGRGFTRLSETHLVGCP